MRSPSDAADRPEPAETGAATASHAGDRAAPGAGTAALPSTDAAALPSTDAAAGSSEPACMASALECLSPQAIGARAGALFAADIDGDGREDPMVISGLRGVWFELGESEPVSHALNGRQAAGFTALDIAYADVSGDGVADDVRIVRNGCGDCPDFTTLEVASGDGRGGFADPRITALCGAEVKLRLVDLDGDAVAEIVAGRRCPEEPAVALTVFDARAMDIRFEFDRSLDLVTAADVDGDGVLDLAGVDHADLTRPELVVLPGQGSLQFGPAWRQPLTAAIARDLQAIDLDGDAFDDLIVLLAPQDLHASYVVSFQGGSDGPSVVPVGPEALPVVNVSNGFVTRLIVADVDADCRDEVVLFEPSPDPQTDARLQAFEPLGAESRAVPLAQPVDLEQVTAARISGASYPDLFALTETDELVRLWPTSCGPPP